MKALQLRMSEGEGDPGDGSLGHDPKNRPLGLP